VEGTETQQAEELELFTGNGELILVVHDEATPERLLKHRWKLQLQGDRR